MFCVDRELRIGRVVRTGVGLAALAFVAACSSSADRVGSLGGQSSAGDPRYAGQPAPSDRSYTASIPAARSGYSNEVSSGPLDGGSGYAPPPSQAPVRSAAQGGVVTVAPGDTLYSIARNNNVDVNALIAANGIQPPYGIQAGQRLRLPGSGFGAVAARSTTTRPASTQSAQVQPAAARVHDVKPGDTLYSISRRAGLKPEQVARYNGISQPYQLKVGQRLRIPAGGAEVAEVMPASLQPARRAAVREESAPKPAPVRTASVSESARVEPPERPAHTGKLPDPQPRAASKFRWPVKGRVISRFGAKPNGARNDGINIAVPVGTSVKAAENGVVAYAGNELKGYGNLVLIRHADNWVTAYAHNSKLLVQRGDKVRRGQIIAKAGQTGSVTSPQLHFEIRRGSQATDPLKQLESTQVAGN